MSNINANGEKNAAITIIQSHEPDDLGKGYRLSKDGTAEKIYNGGHLVRGECSIHYFNSSSPAALAKVLSGAGKNTALTAGVPIRLKSKNACVPIAASCVASDGELRRCREDFEFLAMPGVMILDYDPPDGEEPITPDELIAILCSVCPMMRQAPFVVSHSSSSWLYSSADDKEIVGQRGLRVHLIVKDARDIHRAGNALFERLWLTGHGYIGVLKNGNMRLYSVIDKVVWQPERLDFIGGSTTYTGLEQRRPDPCVYNEGSLPLDTTIAMPCLDSVNKKNLGQLVATAKCEKTEEAEIKKAEYLQERRGVYIVQNPHVSMEQVDQILRVASKHTLPADLILHRNDGIQVTVGELLANPTEGQRFADPLEPKYADDPRIAVFFPPNRIYSHAHGGIQYELLNAAAEELEDLSKKVKRAQDVPLPFTLDEWTQLVYGLKEMLDACDISGAFIGLPQADKDIAVILIRCHLDKKWRVNLWHQAINNTKAKHQAVKVTKESLSTACQTITFAQFKDHFLDVVYLTATAKYAILSTNTIVDGPQSPGFQGIFGGARRFMLAEPEHCYDVDEKEISNKFTTSVSLALMTAQASGLIQSVYDTGYFPGAPKIYHDPEDDEGILRLNTWRDPRVNPVSGDCSIFLRHLELIIPDLRDREVLLAWMAWQIQNPGMKMRWALLIQGIEGNGKSTIAALLRKIIGESNVHNGSNEGLNEKYSGYLQSNGLVVIEEVKVSYDRRETMERLKDKITNTRVPIRRMHSEEVSGINRANFILFSNHKDAIIKSAMDRRYAVIYCAQQKTGDNVKSGLTKEYFESLYAWIEGPGPSVFKHFLLNYAIPDGFSAYSLPETSGNAESIGLSVGPVAQAVREAIESGEVGFRVGMVNSDLLARLLRREGLRLPVQKYGEVMDELGLIPHPAINGKDKRTGTPVRTVFSESPKKVRVWVDPGSPSAHLQTQVEVIRHIEDDCNPHSIRKTHPTIGQTEIQSGN